MALKPVPVTPTLTILPSGTKGTVVPGGSGPGTLLGTLGANSYLPANTNGLNFDYAANAKVYNEFFKAIAKAHVVTSLAQTGVIYTPNQFAAFENRINNDANLSSQITSVFSGIDQIYASAISSKSIAEIKFGISFRIENLLNTLDQLAFSISGVNIPVADLLTLNFSNGQFFPSGLITSYKAVSVIFDKSLTAGNDYSATNGADLLYINEDFSGTVDAKAGNDIVIFKGDQAAARDNVGNDIYVFEGEGNVLVFDKPSTNISVTKNIFGEWLVTDRSTGEFDRFLGADRVYFRDKVLAFDAEGSAGQAYRIYQAAFDRAPDQGGLSFWVKAMDNGVSLRDVAAGFVNSTEFRTKYGSSLSDQSFVSKVYSNVLHRTADASGLSFWASQMSKGMSRAEVLAQFSESPENVKLVAATLDNGVWLTLG